MGELRHRLKHAQAQTGTMSASPLNIRLFLYCISLYVNNVKIGVLDRVMEQPEIKYCIALTCPALYAPSKPSVISHHSNLFNGMMTFCSCQQTG